MKATDQTKLDALERYRENAASFRNVKQFVDSQYSQRMCDAERKKLARYIRKHADEHL